ncbi:MAG: lipopolysaccharide biosynthesis protein, partial [Candidatus Eiseniibacteriota bacterium]
MHVSKFIRDSLGFAISQYLVRFLTTVRGLVAARLLGPAGYGAWNAIMLIIDYGTYAPAGTFSGLDRTVPARIVDGDAMRLDRLKRAGLLNVLVTTGLFTAAGLLYFARSTGQIAIAWGFGGVVVALACVALHAVSYYHLTLLRSHGNIGAVSLWFLLQGTIGVGLGLALLQPLDYWGLLWGWFAGTLIATLSVVWRGRSVVPHVPVVSRESLTLISIGFPMFIYTVSNFVMRSLDRVIIFRFLGTHALGLYGLAVMAVGFLLTMPDAIAYVLYPQLVRRHRQGGDAPAAIRDQVHRAMRALSVLMPAMCAIAYLAADDAVEWLLPSFYDGVPALRILCFSAAGLSLANLGSIVLMTLGRQRVLVPAALATTTLGVVLDLLAIRLGHGIRGVAWATFVTYAVNSAVLIWLADRTMGDSRRARLLFIARAFLPLLVAIPLAYGFERFFPGYGPMGPMRGLRFLGSAVGWLLLYGLMIVPLARGIGLKRLAGELEWPWSRA